MWDTAEAFGAPPGIHRGLVKGWLLAKPGRVTDIYKITNAEQVEAETETSDAVNSALIISAANKRRHGGLNNDLGNNYVLGTYQYPDTTEKERLLLGNYKYPRQQQRQQPRDAGGVAFIQRGRGDTRGLRRGNRGGCVGGAGICNATTVSSISEEGSNASSNRNGDTHCLHCGEEGHWVNMCPLLLEEQQSQLQVNIVTDDEAADEGDENAKGKGGFMGIQVAMLQGKETLSNGDYLDNYSTATALKISKYIRNIKAQEKGMQVNCNAGSVKTKPKGEYVRVEAWYIPEGIDHIFSIKTD